MKIKSTFFIIVTVAGRRFYTVIYYFDKAFQLLTTKDDCFYYFSPSTDYFCIPLKIYLAEVFETILQIQKQICSSISQCFIKRLSPSTRLTKFDISFIRLPIKNILDIYFFFFMTKCQTQGILVQDCILMIINGKKNNHIRGKWLL